MATFRLANAAITTEDGDSVTLYINLENTLTNSHYIVGVEDEREKKDAQLDVMTIPLSDSSGAYAMDFTGSQRNISLRGMIQCDTEANLKKKADQFRQLAGGNQDTTKLTTYTSLLVGDTTGITCKVMSIELERVAGMPLGLKFSVELVECSNQM